jgi:hypothetical protein
MQQLRFKPKSIVVEAFQFGVDTPPLWYFENAEKVHLYDDFCIINTSSGNVRCNQGDYIIQSVNKEIFSCSELVFQKTFESILKED